MQSYLAELVKTCGSREACRHLGYASNSFGSLKTLCDLYGVQIPKRSNQHETVEVEPPKPRPQRVHTPASRKTVGVERCVVIGDAHAPFQDEGAVSLALAIIEELKPEVVIFNGDIADFYACSRFSKDVSRAHELQAEMDEAASILARVRAAVPRADLRFVRGNHELRLARYINDSASALYGLPALSVPALFRLDELGISYVEGRGKEAYTRYGQVLIGHFDRVNQHAGYTAKLLLDKHAQSLVQGHTHRGAVVYRTYPSRKSVAGVEGFCLCDTNPEYCSDPDWLNGLVVITKRLDSDRFHITPVPFVGGEALFDSTLYSV